MPFRWDTNGAKPLRPIAPATEWSPFTLFRHANTFFWETMNIYGYAGEGIDTLLVTGSATLEAYELENLTLTNGSGTLTGNQYANVLAEYSGGDSLGAWRANRYTGFGDTDGGWYW